MRPALTVLAFLFLSLPEAFACGDALLRSDPGAVVFVNGRFMGVVGGKGKWILVKGLPYGVHTAEARRKGFAPKVRKFRVAPGRRAEVDLTGLRGLRICRKYYRKNRRPRPRLSRFAVGFGGTHHHLVGKFFGRSDLANIHHDELIEDSYRLDTLSLTYRPSRQVGIGFSYAYSHLTLGGNDTRYHPGELSAFFSLKETLKVNRWGAHLSFRIPLNLLNACVSPDYRKDTGQALRLKVEAGYWKAVPESDRSALAVFRWGGIAGGSWPFPYAPVRYCRNSEGVYFEVTLAFEIRLTKGLTLTFGPRYFNGPALKYRHQPYEEIFLHHGKGARLSGWTFLTFGLTVDL
ncbi:MAG: carboxypeptidase-like regulatory domain-containing protein [Planctomycetota bacterium]|jgi:hypothetical protein